MYSKRPTEHQLAGPDDSFEISGGTVMMETTTSMNLPARKKAAQLGKKRRLPDDIRTFQRLRKLDFLHTSPDTK